MAAQKGDKRGRTCAGTTKDGRSCTSYVKDGETYCYWHRDQAGGGVEAEVISFAKRNKNAKARVADGLMTKEEYARWLMRFMDEDGKYKTQSSTGTPIEVDIHPRDALMAGREFRQLMNWDGAPKGEGAFVQAVADVVADILG